MKQLVLLIIWLMCCPIFASSQQIKQTERPGEFQQRVTEKQRQDDLKLAKAIGFVERTADEAPLWGDSTAAIEALTESSDLLWDVNPQGRVWLKKAWEAIEKIDDQQNSEELRQFWRGSERSRLRSRVLKVALKRDPQLANRFLETIEQNQTENDNERGTFDDRSARSEQLLRLAIDACDSDPALAASLAESSLRDGISFNLQTVLLRLRQKNLNFANRLFDSALARLTHRSAASSEAQILASYLFRPGQILARMRDGAVTVAVVQTKLPEQTPAQSDPVRARSFLTIVQRILLSEPLPSEEKSQGAAEFVLLANSLAQPFQTYAPELWGPIEVRTAQFAAALPTATAKPNSGLTEKVREAAKRGASSEEVSKLRVEALEAEAEKESQPIARKLKFAEAALATAVKEFDRGKDLAQKIENDDQLREEIITFLYYRAALTFVAESDYEKAEEIALRIPPSIERALPLIAVAQKLAGTRQVQQQELAVGMNRQHAIDLLFEAEKSLKGERPSASIARVRLGTIAIWHLLDPSQALTDFGEAVALINRLERFDPTDETMPRLGIEGFTFAKFTVPRVSLGFGFRSALEPLINEDFDAAAAAIDVLASPSVRGFCRLEAARLVFRSAARTPQQTKVQRGMEPPGEIRAGKLVADHKKH